MRSCGSAFIILPVFGLIWHGPSPLCHAAENQQKPNVILVLIDDQGWGDLGSHGNPYVKTPNMDAFARVAAHLPRFHVNPVCAPTRASLMTGRYNFRTGVTDVFDAACNMDPGEVTVAEALGAAGYATGIFGKWHLGSEGRHAPNAQGFQESLVFRGSSLVAKQYFDPTLLHNGKLRQLKGYCTDVFTEAAIGFIKAHRSEPFFVYLATNVIHTPLRVADELAAPFRAAGLDEKTAAICGMLENVDDNFGRLRKAIKGLGLEDNTLLIFTSDNGPCAGSVTMNRYMAGLHGLKGTVYENGIRVPCYVRWPAGFKSPTKVERLAAHIDMMPTILDACGVAMPKGVELDGVSLLPLLRNPRAAWPERTLFLQWDAGQVPRRGNACTVVTERWKLVQPTGMDAPRQQHIRDRYAELCKAQGRGERTMEGSPRYELYDIAADPGETKDLAGTHPQVVEKMKQQYVEWFDDVTVRWPKQSQ